MGWGDGIKRRAIQPEETDGTGELSHEGGILIFGGTQLAHSVFGGGVQGKAVTYHV
jgi:hypothetical protein